MRIALGVLAMVLLALGALVVVCNVVCVLMDARNRRRGIDRHVSTIPFVAQICVGLAAQTSTSGNVQLPAWIFWLVALTDPGLWDMARALFRRRRVKPTE